MKCPAGKTWCTDHIAEGEDGKPVHQGHLTHVTDPTGEADSPLITAELYEDTAFIAPPNVLINLENCDELVLQDDGILRLAEQVEELARSLRRMYAATHPAPTLPVFQPGQAVVTQVSA
ncbi:DUF6907 domain-containing protein [Streptomyces sp. NPDC058391]|uniref:DUF6907 domain-containing protein n=1 Tax=Streptomyces sp. NPDC058391 TaxID=3346476 RepID=UPI00364BA380